MTSIGVATLQIIPVLDGVSRAITSGTRNMTIPVGVEVPDANRTGAQAGAAIDSGLQSANVGSGMGRQIEGNVTSGGEGIGRKLGGMISTGLKATAVVAGTAAAGLIGSALSAGFQRLTAIDDARFKLQGLGNDTAKVQSIMDNALTAVRGTAFGLDEAATTAANAVAAGIAPGEQLTAYLKTTASAAALAGTNMADMGRIVNQVSTSGKAMTGDLNQLADRGLPVFKWFQDATGKTGEEFSKFVEEGGINAELFQKVIQEHVGDAATQMGGSISGNLANLKASFSRFGAELAGPLLAGMAPLVTAGTAAFDQLTTIIKPATAELSNIIGRWATDFGAKLTGWLKGGGVDKVMDWISRFTASVKSLVSGGGEGGQGAGFLSSISTSVQALGPALANSGPALKGLGDSMQAFGKAIIEMGPETISAVLVPAMQLLAGALKFVADNASWAVPTIVGLMVAMKGITAVGQTITPIFAALSGGFKIINTPLMVAQNLAIRQQSAAMTQLSVALGVNTAAQAENTVASNASAASTIRGRIAAVASAVAQKAMAVATAAWTGAQWLLNAALNANPIGIVVLAIAALVGGIIYAYNHSETFRNIVQAAWKGIKDAVSAAWEWIKTNVLPGLKAAWDAIAAGAMWLWNNAIKPAWAGIQQAFQVAWPILKGIFDIWKGEWSLIADGAMWLWNNAIQPAWEGIKVAFNVGWGIVKGIFDTWVGAWKLVGDGAMFLWNNAIVPAWEGIKAAFSGAWDFISGIFDKISTGWNVLKDGVVAVAGAIKSGLSAAFSGLGDLIKAPLHALGSFLAGVPTSVFGVDIPGAATIQGWGNSLKGLSEGGYTGNVGEKVIAGVVHGDEYVIRASSRRTIENLYPGLLDYMNGRAALPMPGYEEGGRVSAADVKKYAQQLQGGKYVLGGPPGPSGTDCSGAQSWVANYITGASGRFATGSEAGELARRGFTAGDPPKGMAAYWIGWKNGGPQGGHTAGTIVDPAGGNVNVEMGGASGGGSFGGSATGASGFPNRAWIQLLGAKTVTELPTASGAAPGTDTGTGGAAASGAGGASLPTSFTGLARLPLDGLGAAIGKTSSGSDLSVFGKAAGDAVAGQIASGLNVLGLPDSPPILQAASKLFGGISIGGAKGAPAPGDPDVGPVSAMGITSGRGTGPLPGPAPNVREGGNGGDTIGAVYQITAGTVPEALTEARQREEERAAARLQRF